MDIEKQVEALFESEARPSLRYWLDRSANDEHPADRALVAHLALEALIALTTWDARESRPVIWTLARLVEQVRQSLNAGTTVIAAGSTDTMLQFAARQVILELAERRLIFVVASDPADLTAHDLSKTSFIVKTWDAPEIREYAEFLQSVCENEPYDTRKE